MDQYKPEEKEKAEKNPTHDMAAVEAAKLVSTRWSNYVLNTASYRRKIVEWYRQYRGIPNRKNYDGLANVCVNETLEAVEAIVAQLYNILYSEPKPLLVAGREETDEAKAQLVEDMTIAALDEMSHKSKVLKQLRQYVKYGTTVAEVPYRFEERDVMTRVVDKTTNQMDVKTVTRAIFDNPDLRYIDLLDVAFDPGKSDVRDMDWIIIRQRVSWDYIKANEMRVRVNAEGQKEVRGVYGNLDACAKLAKGSSYSSETSQDKNKKLEAVGIQYSQIEENDCEILKMYGKVPLWWVDDTVDINSDEAGRLVEGLVEVYNGATTIRLHRNPYWHQEKPILLAQFITVDDEAHGMGVCEITESLQQELNDKRNQLLDHASISIMPPLIKNRASNILNENIEFKPRKIISSDVPGDQAISPLRIGGNPMEIAQMDSIIKQDIRNQSGANNPLQGIASGGDSTAFEVSLLEKRSASRINVTAGDFAEKFLKPFYKFVYKLLQQYVDTERAVRTVGKNGIKWEKVSPMDLMLDLDLIPKVPTDGDSRVLIRNQMIQFLTAIAKFYPQVNAYKMVRKIYSMFGFDDVDSVVPAPDTEKGQGDISSQEEMMVLSMGQKIDVKYFEDHVTKIDMALNWMGLHQGSLSPPAQEAFEDYVQQHKQYLSVLQTAQSALMAQRGAPGGTPGAPGINAQNIPAPGPSTPVDMMKGMAQNATRVA